MDYRCEIRARRFLGIVHSLVTVTILGAFCPCDTARGYDPFNGDYTRDDSLDVRVLTYNHNRNFIEDSSADAEFDRILTAIDPDIIVFQEFTSGVSASTIENRLDNILPVTGGWEAHLGLLAGIRTVVASRYSLSLKRIDTIPAAATRGVTIALADLPDADYPVDLYILGVHLKCCGNPGGSEDDSRQRSADAIANWLGDARGVSRPSGNQVTLASDTPMVVLGDFNMVGGPGPETTLLTGDIDDESTYGTDVSGDWDVTDITNLNPLDPFTGDNFTWQGNGSFDPSPLDRIMYTDSVAPVANSFILNTDTMTPAALAAAGLLAGDTLPVNSSDHLPVVVDFRVANAGCTLNSECDDGVFCNGAETCDNGMCVDGSAPCSGQMCNEQSDTCVECLVNADCIDNLFCNGVETCSGGDCQPGSPVICNDNISCTQDACDEQADACDFAPNDAACDNGLFCDGTETCTAVSGCVSGTPVVCDDGVSCTVDACDEALDTCTVVPDDGACDNEKFCDGVESCHPVNGCESGTPVNCDDNVACTNDSCVDVNDECVHQPVHALCDNSLFCDGVETCNQSLGCVQGSPVVCDDMIACTTDECDEGQGACTHTPDNGVCDDDNACTGDACSLTTGCVYADLASGANCDDGDPCNGLNTCDGDGTCTPGSFPDCNLNAIDDACDIAGGESADANSNQVPDDCEDIPTTSEWGKIILTLTLFVCGTIVFNRRGQVA